MSNIPSKQQLLDWIRDNPGKTNKREIARAFNVKGAERIDLKRLLKELTAEGHLQKDRKTFRGSAELPPVSVLVVDRIDQDGALWARPVDWRQDAPAPKILFVARKGDPALAKNDQILCRLAPSSDPEIGYEARLIRKIGSGPPRIIGLYRIGSEGGRVVPVDKKIDREYRIAKSDAMGAKEGELVEAQQIGPRGRMGLPVAKITERLGDPMAPKAISLIAIHQHGIPDEFPDEVVAEAEAARAVPLGDRRDLRDLPLLTIDPADARDRDDAVCAFADDDPKNAGGYVIWVAIADVAQFVRPGSRLDREARKRGNSSYFPDRVVPMLPEALSGDLCSLHADVDRACIALRFVLNSAGDKIAHEFCRGLMRSSAALSYHQAQAAADGHFDEVTKPLAKEIDTLFAAYRVADKARRQRQPLELALPERKIVLSEEGKVLSVDFRERFDAHRLIEDFMVTANVCAAETLDAKHSPLLYRVHEEPSPEKLDSLREIADAAGLKLAKGQVLKTQHLNQLLNAAAGTEDSEVINMSVLRSMMQAYYGPVNLGHFGLNLRKYAHFTSPIRRYSDLIVHRALISAHKWGDDGLTRAEVDILQETGDWISQTERRSMLAERDTTDRYLAAFLAERVGDEFTGRVSGIARFGLFVKLDETGADGIIPLSHLGREYWRYNEVEGTLRGEDSGRVIAIGMPAVVRLAEAEPITGGLTLEMLELNGKPMPKGTSRAKPTPGRKLSKAAKHKRRRRKA